MKIKWISNEVSSGQFGHCGDIRYPPSDASCEAGAMRGAEPVCTGDRLVLRAVDVDGARQGGLQDDG